jgi:hypothetical protein
MTEGLYLFLSSVVGNIAKKYYKRKIFAGVKKKT